MPKPSTPADLFWRQSENLFNRWESLLDQAPNEVLRECALYRRWLMALPVSDVDSATVQEILLEMLADLMVEATLRK